MTELFNRNYSILVGPINNPGILVTGLRVTFAIEKSLESNPNTAKVEIYNLSKQSRSIVEEKKSAIIVNAGYGDSIKNIFVGDIARVSTKRDGPDIITSIEAGDGEVPFAGATLDVSFAPGTSFRQVFETIKNRLGISVGQIKGVNLTDQFQNGLTLSGPVRKHLDDLMSRQGLEWSIQNNQLQVLPVDEPTNEIAVILNSSTGLIGTPFKTKVVNQNILKKKDGIETESGIQCVSLLNGTIVPGRQIQLQSKFITGVFKVSKTKLFGDTHGTPWFTEIEAI